MSFLTALTYFLFGYLSHLFWSRTVVKYFYDNYSTWGIYLALNLILGSVLHLVINYLLKGL